ncbi:MAG: alcohol dehydrogenase catalytic domain-containing protein [Clostridiales bacterium]|jgi:threonine dehydrogenase-like Zn-dependent dehydrogenase|nr:alcohol dehydrogenase catalytic domain-containing protein [Clostridiales bacterium]
MKVWQIKAPNSVGLQEVHENITPDTVKVKLTQCVLAGSDLQSLRGLADTPYPFVPGRLGVGVVSEAPDDGLKRGQRVAVEPYIPCGECAACHTDPRQCLDFAIMGRNGDGLLRDFVVLPKYCLFPLPDQVRDDEAVFTDYIALALKALDRLGIEPGQHIAVLGASPIGLIAASLAIYYQCVPILIDGRQERLDAARDNGVYYTVNSNLTDVNKRVIEITGGRLCERSVFCMAGGEAPQKALSLTMKTGRVAYAGYQPFNETCNVNIIDTVTKSLSLVGVSDGRGYTARAINMLANAAVNIKDVLPAGVPFDAAGSELLRAAASNYYLGMLINITV